MTVPALGPSVLWRFVEESADEAEFLFGQWEHALRSARYNLSKISQWLEDRLLGALDGVLAGGEAAYSELLFPMLAGSEPMQICAAACALAQAAVPSGIAALAAQWLRTPDDAGPWIRRGVELVASASVLAELRVRLRAGDAVVHAALLDAYSFRGVDPGSLLDDAVVGGEPLLQAALRTFARLPQYSNPAVITKALASPFPAVVDAAIEAGLIAGLPAARRQLDARREQLATGDGRLLSLLAVLGGQRERQRLVKWISTANKRPAAIVALGHSGTQAAADTCVELLRAGLAPRLAADALCTITGLDLYAQKLVAPEPDERQDSGESAANSADAEEQLGAADGLPLPDVHGVIAWWNQHRAALVPEVRYLAGQPASAAQLWKTLAEGPMRRRPPIALEVAMQSGGFTLRVDAFTKEQRHQLQQFQRSPSGAAYQAPHQAAVRE